MYRLFPKAFWSFLLLIYGFVVLVTFKLFDSMGAGFSDISILRYLGLIVVFMFTYWLGADYYKSGWRIIWRKLPKLNKVLFPDLNGVWVGTTESNWPVIKKLRESALSSVTTDDGELDKVVLQADSIAIQIKASLFGVKITAKLSNTGGESYSAAAAFNRDGLADNTTLSYVYVQSTPSPLATDQDRHIGAAELTWDVCKPNSLNGVYWTRRSWRRGLNTAGILQLEKVTDQMPKDKCLSDYLNARELN